MAKKIYTPILNKYTQGNSGGSGTILGNLPKNKKPAEKSTPAPSLIKLPKQKPTTTAQGGVSLPGNVKILSKGEAATQKLKAATAATSVQGLATGGLPNLKKAAAAQDKVLVSKDENPYFPSTARMGIKPTQEQLDRKKAQAFADASNSAFTRANIGAFQGASPVKVNLDPKLQDMLDESAAYQVGKVGGVVASFAAPYAGIGKGVVAGASKLAPGIVSGAEKLAAGGVKKILPKIGAETAEKFGKGIVSSAIKDVAIGTPLNLNYAVGKEDKRGKAAVKDVAINSALDLIAGGVLEAAPYVLRSGKKVLNEMHFKQLKPDEQVEVVQGLVEKQLQLPAPKAYVSPKGEVSFDPLENFTPKEKTTIIKNKASIKLKGESDEILGDIPYAQTDANTLNAIKNIADSQGKTVTKFVKDINDSFNNELNSRINELARDIYNYKPGGVETSFVPSESRSAVLGEIPLRFSSNEPWYSDFYRQYKRKPTKEDAANLAEQFINSDLKRGGGEYLPKELADKYKTVSEINKSTEQIGENFIRTEKQNGGFVAIHGNEETIPMPDYSSAVGRTETPRIVRPGEMSVGSLPKAQNAPSQPLNADQGIKTPKPQTAALNISNEYASKTVDVPGQKTSPKLPDAEKIAKVTARSEEIKPSKLEKLSDITGNIKRKFVDSGDTVAKIAKINNDEGLYHLYNNARNSRQRAEHMIGQGQTNLNGEEVGKSLKSIFDPIRKQGDEYYNKFQEYMYHLHNVDRMAQEKPVFGESVTAENSVKAADELLKSNPEFSEYQAEIRKYVDNLMNYRKDSGLVSKESADIMADMYKNYVPTFRNQVKTKGIEGMGAVANIGKTIKKASGGNEDLLPLHEQLSKQTMQTVDAANKNLFGQRLLANANESTSKYIQELKKITDDIDIDEDAALKPELKNAFNIYVDGQGLQLKVDKGLFEGVQALGAKDSNELVQMAAKANQTFKSLITNWNPLFLVRNAGRDIQEVGLTSKDLGEFAKMYPGAIKEIATNGSVWKQYQALGGAGNSFFDYVKGYKDDPSWLKRNTVDRIEALNKGVEQAPRLAEFMATLSKLDREPTHDDLMKAMYNAADVTTNFGRSGTWGKAINSTAVPFFNPSIQGASKLIRTFTEAKGAREWTSLAAKVAGLGLAPSLLNEMVYHDDKQYRSMDDRIKDTNFVFKIGDNKWIKVPKARILSVFGSTSRRTYDAAKGDKSPFAGYFETALEQVGVVNPIEANIAAPLIAAKTNKAWYGGAIDSVRLQSVRPSERADESTSALSKAIVGAMGKYADKSDFSPKKLDYLIDAYSGIIGDVALPLMTSKAEPGMIQKAFTVDTVTQNRIAEDFYNAVDEVKYSKNDKKGIEYDVMNRYLGRVNRDLADKYSQIRDIQSGIGTDKVKAEKVRKIKDSINQQQLQALDQLKSIKEKAEKSKANYSDLEHDKALDALSDEVLGKPKSKKSTEKDEAFM